MPQYCEQWTEVHQPLQYGIYQILPVAETTTPYVALNGFHRAFFWVFFGNMGPGADVVVQVMQATNVAGAGAKVVAGKATAETATPVSHYAIELQTEELDVDGGFDCVALRFDVDDNDVEATWAIIGCVPVYPPTATTFWQEIVQ